jgi:hypothetical protein
MGMYGITLMQLSVYKIHIFAYLWMFQVNPEKCMKTVFRTYQKENKQNAKGEGKVTAELHLHSPPYALMAYKGTST